MKGFIEVHFYDQARFTLGVRHIVAVYEREARPEHPADSPGSQPTKVIPEHAEIEVGGGRTYEVQETYNDILNLLVNASE